jgi:hypothetical protein
VSDFALLSRLTSALPAVAVVVVIEADEPLVGLAWDLGAHEVLPLSRCRDELAPLVARFFQPLEGSHATGP